MLHFINIIFYSELIIGLIGIAAGVFLIKKPNSAIKIQQSFYSKINWDIKPISLDKELRNTKFMGYILLLSSIATLYLLKR